MRLVFRAAILLVTRDTLVRAPRAKQRGCDGLLERLAVQWCPPHYGCSLPLVS